MKRELGIEKVCRVGRNRWWGEIGGNQWQMRKWWWRGGPITVSNAPYHGPPPSTRPTQALHYDGSETLVLWAIVSTEVGRSDFD